MHAAPATDLSTLEAADVWMDAPSICAPLKAGTLHRTVGRIGQTISFEYTAEWLAPESGAHFSLDEQLPSFPGRHTATAGASDVTPAFEDCSPDRWGRLLMERREAIRATAEGRRPRSLRAWDYLLGVNDQSRMGALRFMTPDAARYLDDSSLTDGACLLPSM